jgi:phosphoribosylglycinamide formyltransferase-1
VHFVTEELDGGPVAIQAALAVTPGENVDELTQRVHTAEHQIYPLAMRWFAEGRLRLAEQGAMLDGVTLPASGYQIRI